MTYKNLTDEELIILKAEKEKEFRAHSYSQFIEYGIKDVELLIGLDRKLKLIDLAKMISYETGVTMDMIRGTLAQWNSYMFNNHFKKSHVLPLEGKFDETDTVLLDRISRDEKFRSLIPKERVDFYMNLINEHEQDPGTKLKSQTFPGGIVKGTGKFWRWVYSLDFASLYPSVIQWLNIGIETLIEPKDLPDELLLLRAKYAIFYPRNVKPKDLIQYDFWFQKHVVNNDEVSSEVMRVCKKYNVSMAPNGMFFRKDVRSVLSQTMEDIMVKRKKYKKLMQGCFKEIEEIKKKDSNSDEDKARISEIQKEADKWNVYQLGMKILINSAYGALSMQATVFAGHAEYFSGAVTSGARNANLNAIQANSKHIDKLLGEDDKETFNGIKTYWRHIAQVDTDSGYFSIEPLMIKKWGADYEKENSKERLVDFTKNYIEKISLPLTYVSLNKQSDTINAYLPEKLIEDPEVICDCLPEDAKIACDSGYKKISDVKIGDMVISKNHNTSTDEPKRVNNIRKIKTTKKMLTISNGDITIRCTEDHRIYTNNRGYIYAKSLKETDDLVILGMET